MARVSIGVERESLAPANAREAFAALRPARCENRARACSSSPSRNCARCHLWLCDEHSDRPTCVSRDGLIAGVRHTS